jgi:hypothetical protein
MGYFDIKIWVDNSPVSFWILDVFNANGYFTSYYLVQTSIKVSARNWSTYLLHSEGMDYFASIIC